MKSAIWRRALCLAAAVVAAAALQGCAHKPTSLYQWGDFPRQQYDTLRGEGQSPSEQIAALEAQSDQADAGHPLPPGLRAHLGLLYLDGGHADKARTLWLAEKAAFPESAPYIDHLLRRLDAPARAPQADGNRP